MNDFSEFCQRILNIDSRDKKEIIQKVVDEEKKDLLLHSENIEGFCKYIANQILYRLQKMGGIRTYLIDLNEIVLFDHVFLIVEYRNNNLLKRVLIDPTFNQFKKKENNILCELQNWPYEKMRNAKFFEDLTMKGTFEIDDESFNQYLNAFTNEMIYVSLDNYLKELQFKNLNGGKKR